MMENQEEQPRMLAGPYKGKLLVDVPVGEILRLYNAQYPPPYIKEYVDRNKEKFFPSQS